MAVAAQATEGSPRLQRLVLVCLLLTAMLGLAFITIKGFEYKEDIDKQLVPGPAFSLLQPGAQLFYGFYWLVTGVHAIHLSIGVTLVSRPFWVLLRRELPEGQPRDRGQRHRVGIWSISSGSSSTH